MPSKNYIHAKMSDLSTRFISIRGRHMEHPGEYNKTRAGDIGYPDCVTGGSC